MGIARRWVFPILRIIVFAAIAAALVKLAFFADTEEPVSNEFPTGQIVEPHVPVVTGTIRNDIVLEGAIAPAPAVEIVPDLTGEVRSVAVEVGDTVKKGDELARIRAFVTDADGAPAGTRWSILTAPASGTITSLTLFYGESASAGQAAGHISPGTFRVSAPIPPEQQYRLIEQPSEAEVAITGGPAPFACTDLVIEQPAEDAAGEGGAQATVRCTVPDDVRVFAGLTARMTIAGGVAEDVLVVPMTAVLGAAESGVVFVTGPDGEREERPVRLGLNDGVSIEIVDGLTEGEEILEFVPGAPAGPADGPFEGPMPIPGEMIIDAETGEIIGEGG